MALKIEKLENAHVGPCTFVIERKECLAISGASGSGKSQLLRMIADLEPHSGEVWYDGTPQSGMDAALWRQNVLYVSAESGWWRQNVQEHFSFRHYSEASLLLTELGLDAATLMAKPVHHLSTGERQRAALVRALVHKPAFLLLDEPTSALDEQTSALLEQLLLKVMQQDTGLILVSHNVEQANRLAHRRFLLKNKQLVRFEDGMEKL
ncbi:ABC transporter ATP-binding protein [Entomobacter blattae]|uniref:Thiamine import ATP-binding protein ThiQ n=1 Tax=Entomobacter blattae TaxID=2762277 RepID=A0A7H1NP17_9PROT|nr:ATP-binding cassette domain-containing protein [Entomobacter blattae]QNT77527.1 Thiamine import ATP-binding protein ThiQ [Entomobacter blattae]